MKRLLLKRMKEKEKEKETVLGSQTRPSETAQCRLTFLVPFSIRARGC